MSGESRKRKLDATAHEQCARREAPSAHLIEYKTLTLTVSEDRFDSDETSLVEADPKTPDNVALFLQSPEEDQPTDFFNSPDKGRKSSGGLDTLR